jgi:nicotinamide-nucleotide amidase
VLSPEQEAILTRRFQQFHRKMAENNRRQTFLIDGAEALPNANGTAPGQFVKTDRGALILLPGPPRELKPMLDGQVIPKLKAMLPPQVIKTRSFRITGIGESDLDALIAPIYTKYTNPITTVLSAIGDLSVTLIARCRTEEDADVLLEEVGDPIARLLGDRVYSTNGDPLEAVVGNALRERRAFAATAESCTGGLVAARLTEQTGSSDFFLGSFITYTDGQKNRLLGIPKDLLEQYTAVSEAVAKAMAEAARDRTGADYALSVTGYAGPSGGTEENPVGTVFIGLASPDGTRVLRSRSGSDRTRVRALATQAALDMLRRELQSK